MDGGRGEAGVVVVEGVSGSGVQSVGNRLRRAIVRRRPAQPCAPLRGGAWWGVWRQPLAVQV